MSRRFTLLRDGLRPSYRQLEVRVRALELQAESMQQKIAALQDFWCEFSKVSERELTGPPCLKPGEPALH